MVFQHESAGGNELAEDRRLDALGRAQRVEFVPGLGRHGQHHAFLGFGDPDFGIRQTVVFQRGFFEPHFGADFFAHLAHSARQATRAAIGHGVEQPAIAGGEEHIEHHLFGDRVADLHGAAGDRFALAGQLRRTERGAVDAVAAGAATQHDDPVADFRRFVGTIARDESDVAAIDQRIAEIPGIEVDGAIDRRDAHAVPVVPHAGHHALHHASRMQHAWRQAFGRRVGRRETEDIGVAHRLGAEPGSHRVADHAANPRIRAAVRFERRRVIVRFNLEHHVVLVVEADDTRVVLEDADAPVGGAPLFSQLLRRGENRLFEHILKASRAAFVAVGDAASQRLMAAMLAPGLRHRFQFRVGWIASQFAKVLLDRPHLDQGQVELAFAAEPRESVVGQLAERHSTKFEPVVRPEPEAVEPQRAGHDLLDRVVRQDAAGKRAQTRVVQTRDPVLAKRPHFLDRQAKVGDGMTSALRDRIHDARFQQNMDKPSGRIGAGGRLGERLGAHRRDAHRFDHRVGEQFAGQSSGVGRLQVAFQQVAVGRANGQLARETEIGSRRRHGPSRQIGLASGRIDINFPQHRESLFQLRANGVRRPNRRRGPPRGIRPVC